MCKLRDRSTWWVPTHLLRVSIASTHDYFKIWVFRNWFKVYFENTLYIWGMFEVLALGNMESWKVFKTGITILDELLRLCLSQFLCLWNGMMPLKRGYTSRGLKAVPCMQWTLCWLLELTLSSSFTLHHEGLSWHRESKNAGQERGLRQAWRLHDAGGGGFFLKWRLDTVCFILGVCCFITPVFYLINTPVLPAGSAASQDDWWGSWGLKKLWCASKSYF